MAETETEHLSVAEAGTTTQDGQKNGGVTSELTSSPAHSAELSPSKKQKCDNVNGDNDGADASKEHVDFTNGQRNGKRRNRRKARGGKHHKKSWRPYSKLSWEERRKVDEKETIRATRKRDERFKSGLPMAPYNTTQFLMDDQDQPSPVVPDHDISHQHSREKHTRDDASGSFESSDGEFYDSPSDEDAFLEKEFSEAYESFHAERLQQLTKEELVKDYIELETKNEKLEKEIKEIRTDSRSSSDRDSRLPSEESRCSSEVLKMEEEIRNLKEANAKLNRENEFLKVAAGKFTA